MTTIAAQTWPKEILEEGPEAAVTYLAQKVTDSGARYAFVGIGALSIPLVAELKRRNIVAIHTGGGTQIMFGLKGRRWLNHSIISTFFNSAWTSPTSEETPSYAQRVEGACYW
jgi:leucyl aminopeptidase (aminopeptidase T)